MPLFAPTGALIDVRIPRVVGGLWDEDNVSVSPGTPFQVPRLVDVDFLSSDDALIREQSSPGD